MNCLYQTKFELIKQKARHRIDKIVSLLLQINKEEQLLFNDLAVLQERYSEQEIRDLLS